MLSDCLAYMLMRSCDRGTYNGTLFLAVVTLLFRAEDFRELKLSDAVIMSAFESDVCVFRRPRGRVCDATALGSHNRLALCKWNQFARPRVSVCGARAPLVVSLSRSFPLAHSSSRPLYLTAHFGPCLVVGETSLPDDRGRGSRRGVI